jgi:ribosomal protein S18 acetylase RimI-like enzyme
MGGELDIQAITATDLESVRAIVASTEMFYDDEIEMAVDLGAACASDGPEESGYHAYLAFDGAEPVGYICFGPTALTQGTYDLYWLVVDKKTQGRGFGKELVKFVARAVRAMGGRLVIAETSLRDDYIPTRAFYDRAGFTNVGEIPDFYREGDGKVTYMLRV